MMPQELHNFFNTLGTEELGHSFKKNTPIETMAITLAEDWQDKVQNGHGMFFDFTQNPELEKPVIDYLTKGFGWTLEKPYFIRKPL